VSSQLEKIDGMARAERGLPDTNHDRINTHLPKLPNRNQVDGIARARRRRRLALHHAIHKHPKVAFHFTQLRHPGSTLSRAPAPAGAYDERFKKTGSPRLLAVDRTVALAAVRGGDFNLRGPSLGSGMGTRS
jgi:hypothetical protein